MIIEDPSTGLRLPADAHGYNPNFPTEDFKRPLLNAQGHPMRAPVVGARAPIPVFGTVGTQTIRFFVKYFYDPIKSAKLGYEDLTPVEMFEVSNPGDKFSMPCRKVSEMDPWQWKAWGHIYEAFKEQRQIGGTLVKDWLAINEYQRALLLHCGVLAVEQLENATPEILNKLGGEGAELKEKALQHLKTKNEKVKSEEKQKEIDILRKELECVAAASDAKWETKLAAMQAQVDKARQKRTRGPNKKKEEVLVA